MFHSADAGDHWRHGEGFLDALNAKGQIYCRDIHEVPGNPRAVRRRGRQLPERHRRAAVAAAATAAILGRMRILGTKPPHTMFALAFDERQPALMSPCATNGGEVHSSGTAGESWSARIQPARRHAVLACAEVPPPSRVGSGGRGRAAVLTNREPYHQVVLAAPPPATCCLDLAADFAVRSAGVPTGTHPIENYDRLRSEGFLELTTWQGMLQRRQLPRPSTRSPMRQRGQVPPPRSFNMAPASSCPCCKHRGRSAAKELIADLVVRQQTHRRQIFRAYHVAIGERPLTTRATWMAATASPAKMCSPRWRLADHVMVMAYPDDAISPVLLACCCWCCAARPDGAGTLKTSIRAGDARRAATLPIPRLSCAGAVLFRADDNTRRFRSDFLNWFWVPTTAVYLELLLRHDELRRKSLRYAAAARLCAAACSSSDVRRHIAS